MNFFIDYHFSFSWLTTLFHWLAERYVELLATVSGLVYVIYSVKGDKKLWFYGLFSSALYVYVCFSSGIYADMAINTYYVVISIYGWIHWSGRQKGQKEELPISGTSKTEAMILIGINSVLFILIAYVLSSFTDSNIPYWDAFTTSGSIVATWMLANKKIEHWILWVIIDGISIGLYVFKGLYPTSGLFLVYTVLSVFGYLEWKKKWLNQREE